MYELTFALKPYKIIKSSHIQERGIRLHWLKGGVRRICRPIFATHSNYLEPIHRFGEEKYFTTDII